MISRVQMRVEDKIPVYKDAFFIVVFTQSHWPVNLWRFTFLTGFHGKKLMECHQLLIPAEERSNSRLSWDFAQGLEARDLPWGAVICLWIQIQPPKGKPYITFHSVPFHSPFLGLLCPGVLWKTSTQDKPDEKRSCLGTFLFDGQGLWEIYWKHAVMSYISH